MLTLIFLKGMIAMRKNNVLSWILLFVPVLLVTHPARIHAAPQLGVGTLKIIKNGIDYEAVSFGRLFFGYQPPIDIEHPDGNITKGSKTPMVIPKEIKDLNGKKVSIKGFVIPLANSSGERINEFLFADELVSCLFCAMLGCDQWIMGTTVDPKGFRIKDDQYEEPITIYGTLEVGPFYEAGQFICLYKLKADGFEAERNKFLGIF